VIDLVESGDGNTQKAKEVLGVVPETANAYPDLTAWQNMMLIASLYGAGGALPKRFG